MKETHYLIVFRWRLQGESYEESESECEIESCGERDGPKKQLSHSLLVMGSWLTIMMMIMIITCINLLDSDDWLYSAYWISYPIKQQPELWETQTNRTRTGRTSQPVITLLIVSECRCHTTTDNDYEIFLSLRVASCFKYLFQYFLFSLVPFVWCRCHYSW